MKLDGIHHVTCITADAPRNVKYYTGVLGLRRWHASGWIVHHYGFEAAFAVAATLSAFAIPFFLFMDRRLLARA